MFSSQPCSRPETFLCVNPARKVRMTKSSGLSATILILLGALLVTAGGCGGGSEVVTSEALTSQVVTSEFVTTEVPTSEVVTGSSVRTTLSSVAPITSEGGQTRSLFVAVHCEPGGDPSSTGYVALHWPALIDLVTSADEHNMKLTLLMNPQWAMFALEDPSRLALMRRWESNGHELGLHSHGPHMGEWNGYTDQEEYFGSPEFLGTTDDMMELVNKLPASGQMVTACVTSEDQDRDFPSGVPYATNGGGDKFGDLWSTPTEYIWSGDHALQVTHARYTGTFSEVNIDLQQMKILLDAEGDGEVMGVVFHCFEYADDPARFNALFTLLEQEGIYAETVASIMKKYE